MTTRHVPKSLYNDTLEEQPWYPGQHGLRRDREDYDFAGRVISEPDPTQEDGTYRERSHSKNKGQAVRSLNARNESTFAPSDQNLNDISSNPCHDMDIEYLDCHEEPNLVDYSLSTASSDTDKSSPFYSRKVDYDLNLNLDQKQEIQSGQQPKDLKYSTNPLVKLSNSLSRKSKSSYIYQKSKQKPSPEVIENHPPLTRKSILRRSVDSASSMETSVNSDCFRSGSKKVRFFDQKKRKVKPSVELVELVKSDSETSLESRSAVSFISLSEASLSSGTGSLNLVDYSLTSLSNEPVNFMGDQHAMGSLNPSYEYKKEDLTLNIASPFTRLSRQYSSNDSDYSTESNESIYALATLKTKPKADNSSDDSSTQTSAYSSSSSIKSPFAYSKTKVLSQVSHTSSSDEEKADQDADVDDNTLSKLELKELPEDSDDNLSSNSNSTLAESSPSDPEPEYITSPSGVMILKEKFTSGSEFESSEDSESGVSNPTWLLTVKEHRAGSPNPIVEYPEKESGKVDEYEKEIDFTLKNSSKRKLYHDEGCQFEQVEMEHIQIETIEGDESADNTSHNLPSTLSSDIPSDLSSNISPNLISSTLPLTHSTDKQLTLTHAPDTSIDPTNISLIESTNISLIESSPKKLKNNLSQNDTTPGEKWNSLKIGSRRGSQEIKGVKKGKHNSSSSDENDSHTVYRSPSRSRDGSPAGHVSRRASRNSSTGSKNSSLDRKVQVGSVEGHTSSSQEEKVVSVEDGTSSSSIGSKNSQFTLEPKDESRRISPAGSKNSSLERKSGSRERGNSQDRSRNASLDRRTVPSKRRDSPSGSQNPSLERKKMSSSKAFTSHKIDSRPIHAQSDISSSKILADLSAQSISISVASSFMPSDSEERGSSLQATGETNETEVNSRLNDPQIEAGKSAAHVERVKETLEESLAGEGDEISESNFKGYLDINGMHKEVQPAECQRSTPSANIPRLASAVSLPPSQKSSLRRRRRNNREGEMNSDEENTLSGIGSIEDDKDLVYSIRLVNASPSDQGIEGDNEEEDSLTVVSEEKEAVCSDVADQSSITAEDGDGGCRAGGRWKEDYGCLTAMRWIMCPCADA